MSDRSFRETELGWRKMLQILGIWIIIRGSLGFPVACVRSSDCEGGNSYGKVPVNTECFISLVFHQCFCLCLTPSYHNTSELYLTPNPALQCLPETVLPVLFHIIQHHVMSSGPSELYYSMSPLLSPTC